MEKVWLHILDSINPINGLKQNANKLILYKDTVDIDQI